MSLVSSSWSDSPARAVAEFDRPMSRDPPLAGAADAWQQDLLLWRLLLHIGVRPAIATALATVFVLLGAGYENLMWAFQIGFVIFLPFLLIDLVVASILMALGMMMMPPVMVSLPFKLLLFVMVDGWALVIKSLVSSYG